jgi:hypothetical protein
MRLVSQPLAVCFKISYSLSVTVSGNESFAIEAVSDMGCVLLRSYRALQASRITARKKLDNIRRK